MPNERDISVNVVEALRKGTPPRLGVALYSVGNEKLIEGIKRYHLSQINNQGIIRFVNGSWGSGKTHFFRQLRELAFQNNCLVSNVELDVTSTPLNKFQSVFKAIVEQISTPLCFQENLSTDVAPFGSVIRESLSWLSTGERLLDNEITYDQLAKASEALMSDHRIDIDFKKMVKKYWETYLPESSDPVLLEQTRGEILQWFSGEGAIGPYKKKYDVSKIISKENAKQMLKSLAGFTQLSGYSGLVILFDEAEQSFSIMRKSQLKDAHNNLLSLINNVENLQGIIMIYATTPDFYTHDKHGIIIYGALSGRIGRPEAKPPKALDIIWNLDAIETQLEDYQEAARKILKVYNSAYPDYSSSLPTEEFVTKRVSELNKQHSKLANVRFWRLMVSSIITDLDDHIDGVPRTTEKLYEDVMDRLRED